MEQFLKISDTLKEAIFTLMENFHSSLIGQFDTSVFSIQVQNVCHFLHREMLAVGPLGGLFLDLNLYNLWTLMRNYKNKQKAAVANNNPCAAIAPAITKFLIERILFATDRLFWTGHCSDVALPKPVAIAFFRLFMDLQKKTNGLCKFNGSGRKQIMSFAEDLIAAYEELESQHKLSPKVKLFFKMHFPFVDVQGITSPIQELLTGTMPNLAHLNLHWLQQQSPKLPNGADAARDQTPQQQTIRDASGFIRPEICDLSSFLVNAENDATLQQSQQTIAIIPNSPNPNAHLPTLGYPVTTIQTFLPVSQNVIQESIEAQRIAVGVAAPSVTTSQRTPTAAAASAPGNVSNIQTITLPSIPNASSAPALPNVTFFPMILQTHPQIITTPMKVTDNCKRKRDGGDACTPTIKSQRLSTDCIEAPDEAEKVPSPVDDCKDSIVSKLVVESVNFPDLDPRTLTEDDGFQKVQLGGELKSEPDKTPCDPLDVPSIDDGLGWDCELLNLGAGDDNVTDEQLLEVLSGLFGE